MLSSGKRFHEDQVQGAAKNDKCNGVQDLEDGKI